MVENNNLPRRLEYLREQAEALLRQAAARRLKSDELIRQAVQYEEQAKGNLATVERLKDDNA